MPSNTKKLGIIKPWVYPSLHSKDHSNRVMILDLKKECIELRDEFGTTDLQLAQLPQQFLTFLMLHGLRVMLRKSSDIRSMWVSLKNGYMPPAHIRDDPNKPPAVTDKRKRLTTVRQAILEALLADDGCRLSREQATDYVMAMDAGAVQLWSKEPEVMLQKRRLKGEKIFRLRDMVEGKKKD